MRLINTTDFADHFLRRMVSWCCRELGLPVRYVREVAFRNSRSAWGGMAYTDSRRIGVRIGDASHFPLKYRMRGTGIRWPVADRTEAFVMITAHELAHLLLRRLGNRSRRGGGLAGSEHNTDWHERKVLEAFQLCRDELLSAWNAPPKKRGPKANLTVQERRAASTANLLIAWQRKLKMAQTKVQKYKARVRYYDRAFAAKQGGSRPVDLVDLVDLADLAAQAEILHEPLKSSPTI